MARRPRVDFPNAWIHIIGRTWKGHRLFPNAALRDIFLELVQSQLTQYRIECHAYGLQATQYDLMIRTSDGGLAQALRQINGIYAQTLNRHLNREGPVFKDRYKTVLIQNDALASEVVRHIHHHGRLAASSQDQPAWVSRQLWPSTPTENPTYRRQVTQFYKKERLPTALGDISFLKKISAENTPAKHQATPSKVSIEDVITQVGYAFGVDPTEMTLSQQGRGNAQVTLARSAAMAFCRLGGNFSLNQIAIPFGVTDPSTVSRSVQKFRSLMQKDPQIKATFHRMIKEVFA